MSGSDLSTLIQLNSVASIQDIRRHLTMGPCCMLGAAVETAEAVHPAKELVEKLSKMQWPKVLQPVRTQLTARRALIRAYHNQNATSELIKRSICRVVLATQAAWQYKPTSKSGQLNSELLPGNKASLGGTSQPSYGPSFLSSLGAESKDKQKPQNVQRLVEQLYSIAAKPNIGWTHPGLQLAGGMLAALTTKRFPPAEYTVQTVAMFAASHPQYPSGVVARLTMQRVSQGCGLLLPDPVRCGYLLMLKPSLAIGLQNALHAARGYVLQQGWNNGELDYDWQWSLDLLHARANLSQPLKELLQIPIEGRSIEVAFTCAMIAAAKGNPDTAGTSVPLDSHIGATASLDTKSAEWTSGNFQTLPLIRVDSIDDKTILGRMESMRLASVVVAEAQPDGSLPTDNRYEFAKKQTLQSAYEALVRLPRISRAVNRAIHSKATQLLADHCKPYIEPALAWEPRLREPQHAGQANSQHAAEPIPLTEVEFAQLCCGRLKHTRQKPTNAPDSTIEDASDAGSEDTPQDPGESATGNRIWICAESGLGKSMFILYCQQQIAASDSGLVPIRLGRTSEQDFALSSIDSWQKMPAETFVTLPEVMEFLDEAYPPNAPNQLSNQERVEWFTWLWANGRLFFLLDALDQTDREMQDLGHFLQTGHTRRCDVIVTGRPESLTNQGKFFRGNIPWTNLRLLPFDRPRQVQYLGDELAAKLLPTHDKIDWRTSTSADELRRHHWKELLEVPLLLCLLRTLALETGMQSLDGINSKYQIYDRVVNYLVRQAPNKIEDRQQLNKIRGNERDLLEEIAWFMFQESNATNQFKGRDLLDLRNHLKKHHKDSELLDIVARINIATLWQIFERTASATSNDPGSSQQVEALAFRHRSFLEFFAGCYFANRLNEREQESILVDIHAMLDEEGNIRQELLPHVDRPAICQETLRFALSAADPASQERLAGKLIELGNPWIVYHSLVRDHATTAPDLEALVRQMVHQDWSLRYDFTDALQQPEAISSTEHYPLKAALSKLNLAKLLHRSTRDAAWLSPLRGWLGDLQNYTGYSQEGSLLERMRRLSGGPLESPHWNFLESFVPVRGGTFDIGRYHEEYEGRSEYIADFALADFPVTNELFELFCPSHRRWRDRYSEEDDQPVLYVNHYMAMEFCQWLSALTGEDYRLPTEWSWEWACRWLGQPEPSLHAESAYWWGNKMRDELCWYSGSSESTRTRSRSEAVAAFREVLPDERHPSWRTPDKPGLLDVLGNVWEWSESRFKWSHGGGWDSDAANCRSAIRIFDTPTSRTRDFGIRLALVPSSKSSMQTPAT